MLKARNNTHFYISIGLIFSIVLLKPSILFYILLPKIGIYNHTFFALVLLLFGIAYVALFTVKGSTSNFQKSIRVYYYLFIIWFFIVWLLKYDFTLTLTSTKSYIITYSLGLILFYLLIDRKLDFYRFVNAYLLLVTIFAGLSLIQYFGTYLGFIQVSDIKVDEFHGVDSVRGIGGYVDDGMYGEGPTWLKRNIGFFSEPTYFAQFLHIPMYLSFAFFNQFKKRIYIIAFLIIATAFFLTFSVANFIGVGVAVTLYTASRVFSGKHKLITRIFIIILLGVLIYFLSVFWQLTQTLNSTSIIGKNIDWNIEDRISRFLLIFNDANSYFFGNIYFRFSFVKNLSFFGTSLMGGGIPLMLGMAIFLFSIYRRIIKETKRSKFKLLFIAYISILFPTLWVAEFYEAHFVFLWVFLAAFMSWENRMQKL